jgi:hypothetical protein
MATTKELRDLYLSINEQNEHHALLFLSKHLIHQYCLLDEDGFTISIFYGKGNAVAYYENRKTDNSFLDFIGVADARLEFMVFIGRIMQLYAHDLGKYESKMIEEVEELTKDLEFR